MKKEAISFLGRKEQKKQNNMAFKMKGYSPFTKMDVIHYPTDKPARKVTYEEGVKLMNKQESVKFTGADLKKALNDPKISEFSGMGRDEKTRITNQDERETMEKSIEEKNRKNPPTYNPQPKD